MSIFWPFGLMSRSTFDFWETAPLALHILILRFVPLVFGKIVQAVSKKRRKHQHNMMPPPPCLKVGITIINAGFLKRDNIHNAEKIPMWSPMVPMY